jgi:integrase
LTALGKQRDVIAHRCTVEGLTKKDMAYAQTVALKLKEEAQRQVPVMAAGADSANAPLQEGSTIGLVYSDMIRSIEAESGWSERTSRNNRIRVAKHLEQSTLWHTPIQQATVPQVVQLMQGMSSTPDQQRKIGQLISKTFTHAVGHSLVTRNLMPDVLAVLRNVRGKTRKVQHFAHLDSIEKGQEVLRKIMASPSTPAVRNALIVQAHTALRSGEVSALQWDWLGPKQGDGSRLLTVPRSVMKVKDKDGDHVLTLPAALVRFIEAMPKREGNPHLFPAGASGHIGIDGLSLALRRLDVPIAPHGWRSTLRTLGTHAIADDGRPVLAGEWLEQVLDHAPANKVTGAYLRLGGPEASGRVLSWWCTAMGVLS